jgi:ElaB/YqjD/DUF883 family membrane-anchored ribosome-binding protein
MICAPGPNAKNSLFGGIANRLVARVKPRIDAGKNFLVTEPKRALARLCPHPHLSQGNTTMVQASTKPTDFNRAFGDAKKQAGGVADAFSDAAQDVYGQARESAADVVDTASSAARKTVGSFEQAIRNTIETQPYTAAVIALGVGWLLGRMHRPL